MPRRLDLTGELYGELKVIEMLYNYNNTHRTYCRCVGENENEVIVRADALRSGATVSVKGAGKTGKPADITGQKFGLLTAIRATNKRTNGDCIIWECVCDCGNVTEVCASNLIRKHTLSCGCRHLSKWEMFIGNFLHSLNIDYYPQKRFNDCRNQKGSDMLPFDFYIQSYNLIIEYDGQHHFEPIQGWGGFEKFLITQQNDSIKNNYCKEHNINLLRIPYTYSESEIKESILNILNPVTTTVI